MKQKIIIVFLLIFGVSDRSIFSMLDDESDDTVEHHSVEDSDEKKWMDQNLEMLRIVEEYEKKGQVSVEDQKTYSQLLTNIEDDIKALDPDQYDVKKFTDIYVTPYKEFEDYIASVQEETPKDDESQKLEQQKAEKRKAIFDDATKQVVDFGDEFSVGVEKIFEGLGEYSTDAQEKFYDDLFGAVETFKTNMTTVQQIALSTYFSFLEKQGESDDPRHLTPDQHELINNITTLTDRAVLHVEGTVLDLTTQVEASKFKAQTADAFEAYEKAADENYAKVLEENKKNTDKDLWDLLKDSGKRIMKTFGVKMEQEIKKQAAEQAQKLMVKAGEKIVEVGGKYAKEAVQAIEEKAAKVGGEAIEKLKQRAKELGGDTFDKIQKQIKDIGGKAVGDLGNDTLNKVRDKITSEVKKQVSNQIGIDVDALSDLISGKGISPEALQKTLKSKFSVPDAQKTAVVSVKKEINLCKEEKLFIKNRLAKVEKVLHEHFEIDTPLRLAFSCSGGGNRALIGTLGLFIAAARHKFLDASMYLTGLSGSTWVIAPWSYMYLKGDFSQDLEQSLQEFKEMLESVLDYSCPLAVKGICPPDMIAADVQIAFANNLAKRFAYDQRITAVDIFGGYVGNFALQKVGISRLDITWSSLKQDAQIGAIPLPICSSVFDLKEKSVMETGHRSEYEWFESGPFEAGSTMLGFIPTWALGSIFKDGTIVSHAPEYPISFFLGVYGSAFGVSVNDLIDKGLPSPSFTVAGVEIKLPVDTWVRSILDQAKKDMRSKRPEEIHAQFPNYSQGLSWSALKDKETFGQFDGGMYFNIPLPLLFDRPRDVDVVIMYDSNPVDVQCLVDASRYFKRKGIAMPDTEYMPEPLKKKPSAKSKKVPVSQKALLAQLMTVFNDPRGNDYNAQQPTLIYFPTPPTDITKAPYNLDISNYPDITMPIDNSKLPYITPNFKYRKSEIENLVQTMEAVFESQVDDMKKILQLVAEKKSKKNAVEHDQESNSEELES